MSGRQLAEWQAYWSLEPFGPPAEFWRAGLIASMLANVNRAKKTDRVMKPEDYMPQSLTGGAEHDSAALGSKILQTFQDLAELKKHE
jgi:hypothetical protein